ncbi:GNAT family N-acetyltransferase [Metabacillus indicus]|uniref:GNAT family N-acetyltransferase n=1 Tax=Metabacillus indicus TaxID=246786 RepID=UPI002A03E390|nr:GNAT family N-acetyltransferase [Metabacillus indicus]MDX8290420.1 GNAT family N-acetyltransferase [Metabacillus indicus]
MKPSVYTKRDVNYIIRAAEPEDAKELSEVRWKIDGETENLDRVQGEAHLNEHRFRQLIMDDSEKACNLFLVAEADGKIAGFSRCEGSSLQRLAHQAEFGVGVLQEYWGLGIGKNLLKESIAWAEEAGLKKMTLKVLQTNEKAIKLYEACGFEVEGILKNDKFLSDGKYYHTVVMGKIW